MGKPPAKTPDEQIREEARSVTDVFVGRVSEQTQKEWEGGPTLDVSTITVSRAWKPKHLSASLEVLTVHGDMCALNLKKGEAYIIFAEATKFGLFAGGCRIIAPASDVATFEKALGKGHQVRAAK